LIQSLSDRDPDVRVCSALALGSIGPGSEEAVPALLKCINDSDEWVRLYAISTVGQIHRRLELVVPALIDNLRSRDPSPQAIYQLAQFGEAARPAIPSLAKFLDSPDSSFRSSATNALKAIDPKRAAELGVK